MRLTVISIALDSESRSLLATAMQSVPVLDLIGEFEQYIGGSNDQALLKVVKERGPDVCLLDFDTNRDEAIRTAEYLANIGRTAVFAVSSRTEPDMIISAMRAGCTEYLVKPVQAQRVTESFTKVLGRKRETEQTHRQGRTLAMIGAKGGSGVTAIAIHVATFLANQSQKSLLVDNHPDIGDAALYLGFGKHRYHFYELVNNVHRLDPELLQGFVLKHRTGLELLASPEEFGPTPHVEIEQLRETMGLLRTMYDVVVVDCTPGLSEYNAAVIDSADEVYLIATPEVPSIRNLARYIDHLLRFNTPASKIKVVINRHVKKAAISDQQIEKAIRKNIDIFVPNSYAEVIQAVNTGEPVSAGSRSEFARALSRWIESLGITSGGAVTADSSAKRIAKRSFGILGI